MAKIEFTIAYTVEVDDELIETVKTMHRIGVRISTIVAHIKSVTNLGLLEANSIRKVILEGTNEFDCDLRK